MTVKTPVKKKASSPTLLPVRYRWQLNRRLALITLLVLSGLIPATYVWHQFQLQRVSTAMLAKAEEAEDVGRFSEAASYLYRYLQMMPAELDQTDVLIRIAENYDRSEYSATDIGTVIQWYYRALGTAPERTDLRNRLSEIFWETGQFVLAQEEADKVLQSSPDDESALRNRALARAGQYDEGRPLPLSRVLEDLQAAHNADPANLRVADQLASMYRNHVTTDDQDLQADTIMNTVVDNHPDRSKAFLARYRYRIQYGLPGAEEDLNRALLADPDNLETLLATAQFAQRQGKYLDAEQKYRFLIEDEPQNYRAQLGLGEVLVRLGRKREAAKTWQDSLEYINAGRLPILIRLAEVQIATGQLNRADASLTQVEEAIKRLAVKGQEAQRNWAVSSHGLLKGQLLFARNENDAAITVLKRVAATATAQSGQIAEMSPEYQAWLLLGKTYWNSQRWQLAADAFEKALHAAPQSNTARLWAARAWSVVGRPQQSIILCEQALRHPPVPEPVWLMLAELKMREQLRLPPSQQDWSSVAVVLQQAEVALPDSWEIQLLIATQLIAAGELDAKPIILRALANAESIAPDSLPMWTRAIFLYDAIQEGSEADRALQKVAILSDDESLAHLYESAVYARRGDHVAALEAIDQVDLNRTDLRPSVERIKLMIAYRKGDEQAARHVLMKRLEDGIQQIESLSQLAELAVFEQDWEQVEQLTKKLQAIEGPDGALWRFFQAQQLLETAVEADSPEVTRAKRLMTQIKRKRPWWSGTNLLEARLFELQGKDSEAIDRYVDVVRSGLKQAGVYLSLVRLLHQQGRFAEADRWMVDLQQQQPIDPQFLDLASSLAPDRNRLQLALRVGRRNVMLHPSEAVARIWLAQLLSLSGRNEEASRMIGEALNLNPEDTASWTGLLSFYLRVGNREKALEALNILNEHPDISEGQRHWLTAQTFRQLGEIQQADDAFERALQITPHRTELIFDYARFLQPNRPDRAEQMVRQLLEREPDNIAAKSLLASWLHLKSDNVNDDAESLLDVEKNPADQRVELLVRLQSGRDEDRRVARGILESLIVSDDARLEDHEMLARLYQQDGLDELARERWQWLVDQPGSNTRNLLSYIEFLLGNADSEAAELLLERLDSVAPNSFSTLRLRVRFHLLKQQPSEVDGIVEDYVRRRLASIETPAAEKRMLRQVAEMLEEFGQNVAAEMRLQQLFDRHPDERESLAMFWVRNQRAEHAFEVCYRVATDYPTAENGTLLAKVLVHSNDNTANVERANDLLTTIQQNESDDRQLLFAMANLRLKQGRTQDAIDNLRHLTHVFPDHVLACNNLAALLANQPGYQEEAMSSINQAMVVAGRPIAILLDTKAVLLIQQDDYQAATNLLQQAIALPDGTDTRFRLHLALAALRSGNLTLAEQVWKQAREGGIAEAFLTDYEREWMLELDHAMTQSVEATAVDETS